MFYSKECLPSPCCNKPGTTIKHYCLQCDKFYIYVHKSVKMMLEKLDIHKQRMKLHPYLKAYANINSKWIIALNIIAKTIEFLEENTGGKLPET